MKYQGKAFFLRALLASSSIVLLAGVAQAQEREFNITAGDANATIPMFARQSGIQIIAPADRLKGVRTPAIVGNLDTRAALKQLLQSTNLVIAADDGAVVVLKEQAPATLHLTAYQPAAPSPEWTVQTDAGVPASPPTSPPANETMDDIVVTGSRISVAGYAQPTPVTVVGEELLQRDAKVSIGDSIRELPAVGASASPNNGSGAGNIVAGITGLDTVNLRQLGVTRTLVLFDGQRVVQSNVTGQIDLGTIPTALVERIDVVTAGASAAWGSDAVSGVVNLILNKRFDGFRASAEVGDSYKFDHGNYRLSAAVGTGFDDDRGRLIGAVNYMNSPKTVFANQRSWNKYRQLVTNPAYTPTNDEPRYIHVDNIGLSKATTGGLITGGPLAGYQFVGPNADMVRFDPGIVDGPISAGGDAEQLHPSIDNLTVDYSTLSVFGYASYEMTDWLKASVQLNYGETKSRNNSVPAIRQGNLTIGINNAFLPEAARQAMIDAGVTTIPVGTTNMNNVYPGRRGNYSLDEFERALGIPVATTNRKLQRGVFTLEGDLGGTWSWNAYYQVGKVEVYQTTRSNTITANYNRAIDAVFRPGTDEIVCRSTLTDPNNGCHPLNIFGYGVASPEAIAYVNVKPGQNYQRQKLDQTVLAASMQGTLGFGLPAGDIAVAFGAERRTEEGRITSDLGAAARAYSVANFPSFYGKYNVKEAFVEAEIPLLRDSFIQSLSLNTAGRVTDYSTSGRVETWKVGLTSDLNSDIRVRGTISRDIRAPNLNELFSSGLSTLGSAVDPNTNQNVQIFTFASGNPNLTPEIAKTYSAGIVFRPSWLPRFNVSLDYYSINLEDAISSISAAEVLRRCNEGQTMFCSQLIFDGANVPQPGGGTAPALSQINTFPQNIASYKTDGIDFQMDYRMPLAAGDLSLRLVGNYVLNLSQDQLGTVYNGAGAVGGDNPIGGFPRARFTTSATYSTDAFSFTAQTRFIGAAKLVYDWGPKDVDDNKVPAIAYVDLRGSYQLTEGVQLFATIDNLLNQDPPNVAVTPLRGQSAYYFSAVRGEIYDTIGRSYRLGLRFRF